MPLFSPPLRALEQLDDPVFVGVILRGIALAILGLAALAIGVGWGAEELASANLQDWWWGWLAALLGTVGVAVLSFWLFLPVVTLIATLFAGRVMAAVERRFYPGLPPASPAPLAAQAWDGLVLGANVLVWQILALVLALVLPGLGLVLGWLVTAWAIGRGLFVAIAMQRVDRPYALALYRARSLSVLVQGALIAAASLVPILNLAVPVLGAAAMVHVLHASRSTS